MPLQNYGAIMGSMADVVSQPVNSLLQQRDRQQILQQRDQVIAQQQQEQQAAQAQQMQAQQIAQKKEQTQHFLAKIGWALQDPSKAKEAILSDPGIDPRAAEKFSAMSNDEVVQNLLATRAYLASSLGQGPPPPEKPGQLYQTAQGFLPADQAQGKMPYQAPSQRAPTEAPADQRLFDYYRSLSPEQRAQFDQMKGRTNSGGGGLTVDPETGSVTVNQGKTNDVMRTASNYAARMDSAEQLIGSYSPTAKDYILASKMMSGGPVMASIANQGISEGGQKYYQAASDWVRAKLRKESGAVIGPQEMAQEIKTYFPVPGDTQATIDQKKAARAQAYAGMQTQAGGAVTPEVSKQAPAAPKLGDRVKGYIYVGGDPASKSSWVKAR